MSLFKSRLGWSISIFPLTQSHPNLAPKTIAIFHAQTGGTLEYPTNTSEYGLDVVPNFPHQ